MILQVVKKNLCGNQVAFNFFRWKISHISHGFLPIGFSHVLPWQKITTSPNRRRHLRRLRRFSKSFNDWEHLPRYRMTNQRWVSWGLLFCFSLSGVYQKNTGEVPEIIWFAYEMLGMWGDEITRICFHQKLIQGPNPNGPRGSVSCDRAMIDTQVFSGSVPSWVLWVRCLISWNVERIQMNASKIAEFKWSILDGAVGGLV